MEGLEEDAGLAKFLGYGFGDLECTGSVAVDADSLGFDGDGGAVYGEDRFLFDDTQGLRGCFFRIVEESAFEFSRAQAAVGFVATVGEGFGGDGETCGVEGFEHDGAGETDEDDVFSIYTVLLAPLGDTIGDSTGQQCIARGLIVESAVGFDVADVCAA